MSKKSKKEEHKVSMKRPSICALEDVNIIETMNNFIMRSLNT